MIILGIDPGQTTGWGLLRVEEKKITPINLGETKDTTLQEIADYFETADIVVCEDWKTRPKEARKGAFDYDKMIAPQVIGAVRLQSKLHDCRLVMQQASVKPPAYGFSGWEYVKGKKGMHKQDAFAHGVYFAVKHLGALPLKRVTS